MHMPKNITTAQKSALDFHKKDVLAQTNQIKYDCFFLYGTENMNLYSCKNSVKKIILSSSSSQKGFF